MNENAIEVEQLRKSFPGFTLGPVDLEVPKGEVLAIIGPNGSGKTTLFELLMGMGLPDSGTIRAGEFEMPRDEVAIKRETGYVNPDLNYAAWKTVGKALAFFQKFYPTWDHEYCVALLETFRLQLSDRVAELSYGSKIKLNLTMALSHRPKILILDEPTIGLDAAAKSFLYKELLSMMNDETRSILISSHSLSEIERFSDRVGILSEGELMVAGITSEIVSRFPMVEVDIRNLAWRRPDGFHEVECAGSRIHGLMDRSRTSPEVLQGMGYIVEEPMPVSLEEVFLGLTGTLQRKASR